MSENIYIDPNNTRIHDNNSKDAIAKSIELGFGRSILIDSENNIVAGNGYFGKKKKEYELSMIAITKGMSQISTPEWDLDNIIERDVRVADSILEVFVRWNSEYQQPLKETIDNPSPEQLAQIEEFKQKGWIK